MTFQEREIEFSRGVCKNLLCYTSYLSVFFAKKAYLDILSHILQVKCMHRHLN